MKEVKDHFSGHAQQYARFRPSYPDALYTYLSDLVPVRGKVWDCATGNGQVASRLAEKFASVYATDISEQQMAQAPRLNNIQYSVSRAETTGFASDTFDLITVGQALHWFDFEAFFRETRRVCKNKALLAVWGYKRLEILPALDPLLEHFYERTIGPYWDEERKYVTHGYQNIDFPFEEIEAPQFTIDVSWSPEQLAGYLNTWSSVRKYIRQHGESPVPEFIEKLEATDRLEDGSLQISFPVFLRVFRIRK